MSRLPGKMSRWALHCVHNGCLSVTQVLESVLEQGCMSRALFPISFGSRETWASGPVVASSEGLV